MHNAASTARRAARSGAARTEAKERSRFCWVVTANRGSEWAKTPETPTTQTHLPAIVTRTGQVFSNLVGNALRHGDQKGSVTLDLDGSDASDLCVSVHNEGDIPQEAMSGLFEPFHQGPRRRVPSEGLGLGLYIDQQLLLAHDGDIEVYSGSGDGTTFRVRLPRASPSH